VFAECVRHQIQLVAAEAPRQASAQRELEPGNGTRCDRIRLLGVESIVGDEGPVVGVHEPAGGEVDGRVEKASAYVVVDDVKLR
jgi:hypothetical protein